MMNIFGCNWPNLSTPLFTPFSCNGDAIMFGCNHANAFHSKTKKMLCFS